jgi:hypothetical protein
MFELFTGWRIGVEHVDSGLPYIVVPAQQAEALCSLLTEHCISHGVEAVVPGRHHAETPFAMIVRLPPTVDVEHVQEILDSAP